MKKRNSIEKLLEKAEGKSWFSDQFHNATQNKSIKKPDIKNIPQSWIRIHFKTYPRFKKIPLSKTLLEDSSLNAFIISRRSVRDFNGQPITENELSHLLFRSSGLINITDKLDESRRPYPSAGARYPLEIYPLILHCTEIKSGLYHYNVLDHSLEVIYEKNLKKWVTEISGGEKWTTNAAMIFILTGVLDRTRIKYGDRGYRYLLIEAGHLGQNICLIAAELGLGSCPIGGYIDNKVDHLLDIDLQKEVTLYLIAVGRI